LALVSAGAAVVVVTAVSGANNDRGVYAQAVDVHGLATSADMAALRAMDHALAPGSVVLTNSSTDAGQWIDALTAEREYAPSPYQRNIVDSQGRVVGVDPRSVALRRACADPNAAAEALSGIDAIYLGSRTRPGDPPGWEASCLERIPGLMPIVIARDGHAAATVYRVTSATARR